MAENNDKKQCCEELKYPLLDTISEIPSVTLPIVGKLSASADFTVATPSNCSLAFNLLIKLNPLLANLTCVSKILGIIVALKKFATNPLTKGPALLKAIKEASDCLKPFLIPNICIVITIFDSLKLVIQILTCLRNQFASLFEFHAKLDWEAAKTDPILNVSLECAQLSFDASCNNMKQSLQSVFTTIDLMIGLFDLAEIRGAGDEMKDKLKPLRALAGDKEAKIAVQDFTGILAAFDSLIGFLEAFQNNPIFEAVETTRSLCVHE